MRQVHLESKRIHDWSLLASALATVALVWLLVLPQVGRTPSVQNYIDRNERLGIDPSVKFYSELPAMRKIVDRVEAARRRSAR